MRHFLKWVFVAVSFVNPAALWLGWKLNAAEDARVAAEAKLSTERRALTQAVNLLKDSDSEIKELRYLCTLDIEADERRRLRNE